MILEASTWLAPLEGSTCHGTDTGVLLTATHIRSARMFENQGDDL